jgi:predicted aspartyl protease
LAARLSGLQYFCKKYCRFNYQFNPVLAGRYLKIRYTPVLLIAVCLCCTIFSASAQSFVLDKNTRSTTIPFRLVHNMVLVKVKINNQGPFNFILDTGVGLMLITEPKMVDSIKIANTRTIKITGLGEGSDFEALVTPALDIDIGGVKSNSVAAAILKKDYFNLSGFVGTRVHGLLGYEFFNELAVSVNFTDTTITVCRPKDLKVNKKSHKIPITIEDKKPYMESMVTFPDGKKVLNKLIIDLGAGHPLSLENLIQKSGLPPKYINANLGVALNGPITGYISRMNEIELGKFKVKNVITSFPDIDYAKRVFNIKRDGNIGIGLLKRFNLTFDYTNNALYLKPNANNKEPFEHDMSGLEYYSAGDDFNHLIITRVEPGSPADLAGLAKDDEIVSINFKPVSKMGVEEVDNFFKSRSERSLLLDVYHDKKYDRVIITLKRRI